MSPVKVLGEMSSLGTMTGTRVDSATKHVRTCRVSEDLVKKLRDNKSFGTYTAENSEVTTHMLLKDDLFIACKPCFYTAETASMKKAYTVGISSLTGLTSLGKMFIIMKTMCCDTEDELKNFVDLFKTEYKNWEKVQWIPDFFCFGVALTDGYPNGTFGDTALSVQTGGMSTLSNGPFYVNCGDILTWVWDFELPFIETNHQFLTIDNKAEINDILNPEICEREDVWKKDQDYAKFLNVSFALLFLGQINDPGAVEKITKIIDRRNAYNGSARENARNDPRQFLTSYSGVKSRFDRIGYTPRIIPLPVNATYMLKKRRFGKAVGFAKPWESLDIMISRQGL